MEDGAVAPPGAVLVGEFTATNRAGGDSAPASRADTFTGGHVCDEVGVRRAAKVNFECCHPGYDTVAQLVDVEEPSTCTYTLQVCTLAACPPTAALPPPTLGTIIAPLLRTTLSLHAGWWTYEVAPGRGVRQFHAESTRGPDKRVVTKVTQEYSLGTAPPPSTPGEPPALSDYTWAQVVDSADPYASYVSLLLANGSVCTGDDLDPQRTPPRRQTELRLSCPSPGDDFEHDFRREYNGFPPAKRRQSTRPHHALVSVGETETCAYVVVISTSVVCGLPGFSHDDQVLMQPLCVPEHAGSRRAPVIGKPAPVQVDNRE